MSYVGKRILRTEDLRLLTGASRFLADIALSRMLHAEILRSPVAHARLRGVDATGAAAMQGVSAVLTPDDIRHYPTYGNRHTQWPVGDKGILATDKVRFVGDEIAAVAAETPFLARDAVERISVDYEELPVLVDPEQAMLPEAVPIHDDLIKKGIIPGNVMYTMRLRAGDIEQARREAAVTVSGRFASNKPVCNPLEPHGVIASWDAADGQLTIWSSTQAVNIVRDGIAALLGIPARKIRVLAPDIGGGFGAKVGLFAHEIIACLLSIRTRRPVRILLSRAEEIMACTSRCPQVRYAEMMLAADGTIIGWQERVIQDQGAYAHAGPSVMQLGSQLGLLPYKIPNVAIDGFDVYTNKNPGSAYRAFGVTQAVFVRDSLLQMAAERLKRSPTELMLQNTVRGSECPVKMSLGQVVASTGVDKCIATVVSEAQRLGWKAAPESLRGIGYSVTLKHSSCRHPLTDYDYDTVRLVMQADGGVWVQTSCSNIGQGLWTSLAQITADALGVGVGKVRVTGQDSDGPRGLGTWGSRNITITGNAIIRACAVARERLAVVASHLLQSVPSEIAFEDDHAFVRSNRGRSVALARLVQVSEKDRGSLPPDVECAPIEVVASYDSPTEVPTSDGHGNTSMTYSAAAHACYLEVDPGTGMVTILDYLMAEDSGVAINPLIVEGQQQGATAMALSQVLFEELAYDADGQPLNANMRDYYTPLSTDLPNLSRVYDCGVPSATTLLGQRGAGESGNVPPLAAVANAIAQATGIRFTELPITPDKILLALRRRGADAFGLQGTFP